MFRVKLRMMSEFQSVLVTTIVQDYFCVTAGTFLATERMPALSTVHMLDATAWGDNVLIQSFTKAQFIQWSWTILFALKKYGTNPWLKGDQTVMESVTLNLIYYFQTYSE